MQPRGKSNNDINSNPKLDLCEVYDICSQIIL